MTCMSKKCTSLKRRLSFVGQQPKIAEISKIQTKSMRRRKKTPIAHFVCCNSDQDRLCPNRSNLGKANKKKAIWKTKVSLLLNMHNHRKC